VHLTTPLNKVLGLGSAKGGVEHWWIQRLSAAALVPLGLWFAISLAGFETLSYAAVTTWIGDPITAVLLLLSALTVVYHSHLGIQVVVEDYVHGGAKIVVLVLSAFVHFFVLIAAVFSILKVALGAL